MSLLITDLTLADLDALLPANDLTLPAPWSPQASAALDWLLQAEDQACALHRTLRQLRRAIEEARP